MIFQDEIIQRVVNNSRDKKLKSDADAHMLSTIEANYSYNFSWMVILIIQYPQDMIAMQELIWSIKPDLIIETGIAHGGSLIFYASLLELIAISTGNQGTVFGIAIDIRQHNRRAIEAHPIFVRIDMIEGSSIDQAVIEKDISAAQDKERVMVVLDSNHTHDHVLAELEAYAPLVSVGSYCVVFDTIVEDLPAKIYSDRPWGPGDNPKTAAWQYLEDPKEFEIDKSIQHKLRITVQQDGYLKLIA